MVRADNGEKGSEVKTIMRGAEEILEKVGLSLGPIGMTLGESKKQEPAADGSGDAEEQTESYNDEDTLMAKADALMEKTGLSLGPIGMTLGESKTGSGSGCEIRRERRAQVHCPADHRGVEGEAHQPGWHRGPVHEGPL